MQIRKQLRLQAIISLLIVLTIAGLVLTIFRLSMANEVSIKVSEITTSTLEGVSLRNDYISNNNTRAREQYFLKSEKIEDLLRAVRKDFARDEIAKIVEAMIGTRETSTKIFAKIIENREKNSGDGQSAHLSGEVEKRLLAQLNMRVYDQIIQGRALQKWSEDARASSLRLACSSIVVLIVIIAGAQINSLLIRRVITDRVGKLHKGAIAIGNGDLTYRINISGDDEFVDLAGAFNTMTGKLSGLYDELQVEILERKKTEESLQKLTETLEKRVEQRTYELQAVHQQYLHAEKLSAIGKLSASIAHEFNSPLQSVMTVLKGLKKSAGLDNVDLNMLELAIGESERMKKLIGNLRDFNRPTSDRKSFIDMHQSIESILMLTKSDFSKKKIGVILDFSPHLPQVLVVPDQIKQVLLNLLTNAMDACARSGGEIIISTYREGDRVAVAIRDTGIGIPAENMQHIFRPFFTTKEEIKGTGLGLAISFGIVKKHKGELRVESEPGKGATFTILLPINSEENTPPAA